MKILVLHGYGQSAEICKSNMTNKHSISLWGDAELFFLNGPHVLPSKDENKTEAYAWFTFPDNDPLNIPWDDVAKGKINMKGCEESVELVKQKIKELNIDGLAGFSQGSTLAAIVMGQLQGLDHCPKFSIHMSGFYLPNLNPIKTQSLHIMGENDEIVKCEFSEMLSTYFEKPCIVKHKEKHYIPKDRKKPIRDAIQEFIVAQK